MNWTQVQVLITGGASFIGSCLCDRLVSSGSKVRVVDNLSSGKLDNIGRHIDEGSIDFLQGDLLQPGLVEQAMEGVDVLFHLAADHGGRGYVDLHQVECSKNLILDGMVFQAAQQAGVRKTVYASSGCVYPNFKQTDPNQALYLSEEDVGPPYDADNLYGWAKLMGELTLKEYYRQFGMKSASCRYFTVYGPRGHENHAVIGLIAKAFVRSDPFEVWGSGKQIRNWTFVDDIVEGTIRAAEVIDDGSAVNLGTNERVQVLDAVRQILAYAGYEPQIQLLPDMPTGPLNRVANNSLARKLLNWQPQVMFEEGLRTTMDWYFKEKDSRQVSQKLDHLLTERR